MTLSPSSRAPLRRDDAETAGTYRRLFSGIDALLGALLGVQPARQGLSQLLLCSYTGIDESRGPFAGIGARVSLPLLCIDASGEFLHWYIRILSRRLVTRNT